MVDKRVVIIISAILLLLLGFSMFKSISFEQKVFKKSLENTGNTISLAYGESLSISPDKKDNTEFFSRMYAYNLVYNHDIRNLASLVKAEHIPLISYSKIVQMDMEYVTKNRDIYNQIGEKLFILSGDKYISKEEVRNILNECYQILEENNLLDQ